MLLIFFAADYVDAMPLLRCSCRYVTTPDAMMTLPAPSFAAAPTMPAPCLARAAAQRQRCCRAAHTLLMMIEMTR